MVSIKRSDFFHDIVSSPGLAAQMLDLKPVLRTLTTIRQTQWIRPWDASSGFFNLSKGLE